MPRSRPQIHVGGGGWAVTGFAGELWEDISTPKQRLAIHVKRGVDVLAPEDSAYHILEGTQVFLRIPTFAKGLAFLGEKISRDPRALVRRDHHPLPVLFRVP